MASTTRNILHRSIKDVHKALLYRETTASNLCNDSLKIIDDTQNLNAFITVCREGTRTRAKELDKILETNGKTSGPLHGVPISVKDNFCVNQIRTTCGSKMLHNFTPPYTATAVSKLINSGALVVGKTNMDEFAMGSSCTTSYYGPGANLWMSRLESNMKPSEASAKDWYMAGGSSTGSAISVSTKSCFASLGTDTGGSARQPASLTGTVGFKPSYGLISRHGLIPLAHCLDVVSILTRRVDDCMMIFEAIIGRDDNDLTSVDHKQVLKTSLAPLSRKSDTESVEIRVGIPEQFIDKGNLSLDVSKKLDQVVKRLAAGGPIGNIRFTVKNLSLANSDLATECYTIISSAEIASNMSCYDGVKFGLAINSGQSTEKDFDRDQFYRANRDAGFGAEVKKRILLGNYFLMSENRDKYLVQAQKLRRLITQDFDKAFNEVDIILMPSTPTTSISHDEWLRKQDGNKLFYDDYFLIPANLANLPSISIPCGLSDRGLPVGLQLVANKYHDLDLISVAKFFEQNLFGAMH